MIRPVFQHDHHKEWSALVVSSTEEMLNEWRAKSSVDIFDEMMTLAYRKAVRVLEQEIGGIIRFRRTAVKASSDVLARMMSARDEAGAGMNDQQLRDKVITLLLAMHEIIGTSLTWTWRLIAKNPHVQDQLGSVSRGEIGGSPPCPSNPAKLDYAERVFLESLRLYPPGWLIPRRAISMELGARTSSRDPS